MSFFKSLTFDQKQSIGLLQIGTFLEYFDLMLYVHMAVVLNGIFFEKSDPHTIAILSAFAFCSTYFFRPFGALIFGWIGDNIGRKPTVIITTFMMAISCVIMANLPTYAQIGITATYLVTLCRITQGFSSMGEIMGATIYVTEMVKPPAQYPAVSLIDIAACLGGVCALGISALVTHYGMNWRIAFWVGAGVAVIGSLARTKLRETPEFVDAKKALSKSIQDCQPKEWEEKSKKIKEIVKKEKIDRKTFVHFFFVYCGWPMSFYMAYMYFNPMLSKAYNYSSEDIILHNFFLSLVHSAIFFILAFLSYRIHPLKISMFRGIGCLILSVIIPILISKSSSTYDIFFIQSCILIFSLTAIPANSIFIRHFPVLKRFTTVSIGYAITRALIYIITSFGLLYLTEQFGEYGLLFIMLPITVLYVLGINHFRKLEKNLTGIDELNKIKVRDLYSEVY